MTYKESTPILTANKQTQSNPIAPGVLIQPSARSAAPAESNGAVERIHPVSGLKMPREPKDKPIWRVPVRRDLPCRVVALETVGQRAAAKTKAQVACCMFPADPCPLAASAHIRAAPMPSDI